jgi:hypothetical protein
VQIKEGTVVAVLIPAEQRPTGKRRSIKDLPFYGMWKDRTDIGDGVEYVNKLRDKPRGSARGTNGTLPASTPSYQPIP